MTITEIGCMGVKPGLNIMDKDTPEGKVLSGVYNAVTTLPGGPHRVYWGLEAEDISKLWAFFDWDSIEDHQKFAEEYGAEAVKELPTILTHGEFSKHVVLTPSTSSVLQSPITQVIMTYFPSDISEPTKESATSQFQHFLERGILKSSGVQAVSYGWGVENDFPMRGEGRMGSVLTAFIGLSSSEAQENLRETGNFQESLDLIGKMEGILKLVTFHIQCQTAEKKTE